MREFKVILRGAEGETPFYVVMVRHACRARALAVELIKRGGYDS
jgi:hypothetical protein